MNFVPYSVVATNPATLPSTALLQFNPLPDLTGILSASGAFQNPVLIQGRFEQTLASPTSATAAAGHLDVTYTLQGGVSGTVVPVGATATQPGALSAAYNLTGKLTEILTPPGPAQAWSVTATLTEQGTVSGPLNRPVAGATTLDTMTFNSTIGLTQTELRPATFTANGSAPWSVQATIQSSGKFQENAAPPPNASAAFSVATPFSLQDQITESLSPVSASSSGTPQPPIKVTAVDNATGSVTLNTFPLGSPILSLSGTTQYRSQLTESIIYAPGSTSGAPPQTYNETLNTTGVFQDFGIAPPIALGGDTPATDAAA